MKNKQKREKNATFTIFFTIFKQKMLSNSLLLMTKNNNYSGVFKLKTISNLKPKICCENYCEFCISKKKKK